MTPGPIDTPIIGKAFPADAAAQIREKMIGMVPMKRWGTSRREIAKAVLFLAFDARPSRPAPNFRSTEDGLNSKVWTSLDELTG